MAKATLMQERIFPRVSPARVSPLAQIAIQGRFGADKGAPGVTLHVRHPMSIATVIARKGKSQAVSEALARMTYVKVLWAGPDQYFVQAEGKHEGALAEELTASLSSLASISDQSHGRVVMRIEGPKARAVLTKGTPVDLHPDAFAIGKSAMTQMAHISVHLTRVNEDGFELSLFRGFSQSFWEWLCQQSEEFGYLVV